MPFQMPPNYCFKLDRQWVLLAGRAYSLIDQICDVSGIALTDRYREGKLVSLV